MGTVIGAVMILMIIVMGILLAYVRYRFMPFVLVVIAFFPLGKSINIDVFNR